MKTLWRVCQGKGRYCQVFDARRPLPFAGSDPAVSRTCPTVAVRLAVLILACISEKKGGATQGGGGIFFLGWGGGGRSPPIQKIRAPRLGPQVGGTCGSG